MVIRMIFLFTFCLLHKFLHGQELNNEISIGYHTGFLFTGNPTILNHHALSSFQVRRKFNKKYSIGFLYQRLYFKHYKRNIEIDIPEPNTILSESSSNIGALFYYKLFNNKLILEIGSGVYRTKYNSTQFIIFIDHLTWKEFRFTGVDNVAIGVPLKCSLQFPIVHAILLNTSLEYIKIIQKEYSNQLLLSAMLTYAF